MFRGLSLLVILCVGIAHAETLEIERYSREPDLDADDPGKLIARHRWRLVPLEAEVCEPTRFVATLPSPRLRLTVEAAPFVLKGRKLDHGKNTLDGRPWLGSDDPVERAVERFDRSTLVSDVVVTWAEKVHRIPRRAWIHFFGASPRTGPNLRQLPSAGLLGA